MTMPLETGTGSCLLFAPVRTKVVPFGAYEIVVMLGHDDKFLGVKEIRVARDFMTLDQMIMHRESFCVEDLYED